MKIATILIAIMALIGTITNAQQLTLKEVFVGNEGNFDSGNATITSYNFDTKTATDGVFFNANGVGLGDVVQSITEIDGSLYIAVNNSQKIVIVNPETFQQTGQITFGANASPREIVALGNGKAYVTDLYGDYINIIDLSTKQVLTDTIRVGRNPDQMFKYNDYVFVSNNGFGNDSTISKVEISTNSIVDTITVNRGPASMVLGPGNEIWVVCTGYAGDFDEEYNVIPGTSHPGGVYAFNPETGELSVSLELSAAGVDIGISENRELLYINSGGIRKVFTNNASLEPDTLIKGGFYSYSYDAVGGRHFTGDAKTFVSAGEVKYYDVNGVELGSFASGITPGDIFFSYEMTTSIEAESKDYVENFSLAQNYPNPFNPSTSIEFSIPENGKASLQVFNISGQQVATLIDGFLNKGKHSVSFDATGLSSGLYVYRLQIGNSVVMKKMTLIK